MIALAVVGYGLDLSKEQVLAAVADAWQNRRDKAIEQAAERDRRQETDGSTTHHYYEDDVHDFAWTTSPDYLEREARFEHETLPPVTMRLLLQPEHAAQADRHFAAGGERLRL